jgi:FixJ family two-component response regulator
MSANPLPKNPPDVEDALTVAVVDDDPNSLEQVRLMLNSPASCFRCKAFGSPEAFFKAPLESCDLLIFDEYYEETRVRRASELVEYGLEKFPRVPIIIFSDYPDPTSIAKSERVTAFVDKLNANQHPSVFRAEVSRALRLSGRLSEAQLSRVTDYLQKKDSEMTEAEESISDIALTHVIYPFRQPLAVIAEWADCMAVCSFYLKNYPGFLTGCGPDRGSARLAFYARFHERFQKLFTQGPVYDTPEDQADRARLSEIVDMDQHQALRIVFVPQFFGKIMQVQADGTRNVAWWEGPTTAHRLDEVPSLANLKEGDWVRAVVEKRLATGAIVRVVNVARTSEPKYSLERRNAFWNPKAAVSP